MRPRRASRSWLWLLWLILLAGLVHGQEALVLSSAQFVLDPSSAPPAEDRAWRSLSLPDNWNLSRPAVGGNGWYRLPFRLTSLTDQPYAIYVRKLSMNAAFYVNGHYLGDGGRFTEPVARHWNRPQFFVVPPQALRVGDNLLHVRLWAYPNSRAGLGEIRLGPEAALRPEYERRHFIQTVLPQLSNIVVAALGVFTFALWLRRRSEPTYVYFFVFSLLWALRSLHLFVRDIPVPAFYWDIFASSSFGWCALLFIVIAMRQSGLHRPRLEMGFAAYGVLGPILMLAAGPQHLHLVANNWSFVIVPIAVVFDIVLIREALRRRTLVSGVLALVFALMIAASVHDGLVHRDWLAFDSFYITSHVLILLSLVIGWILVQRFVQAFGAAEKLNLELEQRVAQKHVELEQNFRRLRQMESDRAIAEERERIMSEMHDGIGSQLISALDLVEQGEASNAQIAGELREILDGLRLTIDSFEPTENDLLTVLGNVRYRLEGRLKKQGIALDWQVRDLPKLSSLTPQNALHVLRILQETFTNIVKHARAKTIVIETGSVDHEVYIQVTDDGCGFAGEREGRGLVSMRRRAQALGGRLEINSSSTGTTTVLHIPRPG